MAALNVRELGDFIRDQRRAAHISLRQLAQQAGVSNPYLSQIERGLRKPSAEILQQIAKALRISAEVLYVQAGILEEREGSENLHAAVLADETLTARQKQVILDIYAAFRRENAAAAEGAPGGGGSGATTGTGAPDAAARDARAPESGPAPAAPARARQSTPATGTTRRARAAGNGNAADQPARRATTPKSTTPKATTRRTATTAKAAADAPHANPAAATTEEPTATPAP
ncbi:helix-turn-helix transcriptional regulator [Frankia sp. CNm7]|uniref:helix-turn-helix domain-containing protein n=1 Tax=Frankia nepalensis TaxID=1836974 RepID=UPI001DA29309|nr:helix-turn-helix transcriptional regulator [Frankia nepalensis]MBL7497681.1 helix-turn-helix transcriptional regulator [Frankia nepalensis]MBL7514732.1 helix-turn-helix transcriptional regulator [Frankia nepalensis]MBL7522371.1 helix-turn-helix transcriptional regulator [Frankia nepalensis]